MLREFGQRKGYKGWFTGQFLGHMKREYVKSGALHLKKLMPNFASFRCKHRKHAGMGEW